VKTHSYNAECKHVFRSSWNGITWSRFLTASVENTVTFPYSRILILGAEWEARGYCRAPQPRYPLDWEVPQVGRNAAAKRTCSCTSSAVQCNILTRLWVRFLAGADCLSLPQNMQSDSEAHPAFSLVGTVCLLAGSKTAAPFIYSPRLQWCPYRAIFGKNNQYYWKLLVYRKSWYPGDVSCT